MNARRISVGLGGTLIVVGALAATGCQRSLFAEKQPRTQFEAHDLMRQEYVAPTEPDVFGNPQPALRARLSRGR